MGFDCPACKKRIEPGDKLSVCQVCGAAYHEECWRQIGKCTNPYCSEATSDANLAMQRDIYQERSATNTRADSINDHLLEAVLVTIFCCIPFGIVAIYYASQAKTKIQYKDFQGAVQAANTAQKWITFSIIGGIVDIIIYAYTQVRIYCP